MKNRLYKVVHIILHFNYLQFKWGVLKKYSSMRALRSILIDTPVLILIMQQEMRCVGLFMSLTTTYQSAVNHHHRHLLRVKKKNVINAFTLNQ